MQDRAQEVSLIHFTHSVCAAVMLWLWCYWAFSLLSWDHGVSTSVCVDCRPPSRLNSRFLYNVLDSPLEEIWSQRTQKCLGCRANSSEAAVTPKKSALSGRRALFSRPSAWLTLRLLLHDSGQLSTLLVIGIDSPEEKKCAFFVVQDRHFCQENERLCSLLSFCMFGYLKQGWFDNFYIWTFYSFGCQMIIINPRPHRSNIICLLHINWTETCNAGKVCAASGLHDILIFFSPECFTPALPVLSAERTSPEMDIYHIQQKPRWQLLWGDGCPSREETSCQKRI